MNQGPQFTARRGETVEGDPGVGDWVRVLYQIRNYYAFAHLCRGRRSLVVRSLVVRAWSGRVVALECIQLLEREQELLAQHTARQRCGSHTGEFTCEMQLAVSEHSIYIYLT